VIGTEHTQTSREVVEAVLMDSAERSKLLGYARNRFGIGPEDAEDLLQETAMELLRHRVLIRSPNAYIFKVFHMRCCQFAEVREARREAFRGEAAPGAAPAESLDQQLALKQAFDAISGSCRKLLRAYYVEGRSLREAAGEIALAYSGVWKTMSRCLRRLRECFQ
jgi:RNA polymerase sigma factor (sigma-70 family)